MINKLLVDFIPYIDPVYDPLYTIALEYGPSNVCILWFTVNGKRYVSTQKFCDAIGMTDEESLVWMLKFGEMLPNRYVMP